MQSNDRTEELAARLLKTAELAEKRFTRDEVLTALLSAGLSYGMTRNSAREVVELMRQAAEGVAELEAPRVEH